MLPQARIVTRPDVSRIAVVSAIHNGATTLRKVLDAYVNANEPEAVWRLVIVDDASDDGSRDILNEYSSRLPITILHNANPNEITSFNLALEHISLEADLFVFTAHNAIPDLDFLVEWERIMRGYPDSELFLGEVRPLFEVSPPAWLSKFRGLDPILYAENVREDGPISFGEVFGPNMAVRRLVFSIGVTFDPNIDKDNVEIVDLIDSATEFCLQAEKLHGAVATFVSSPKVLYIVRPYQMTKDFLKKRAYGHGRRMAMRHSAATANSERLKLRLRGELRQLGLRVVGRMGSSIALWEYHVSRGYRGWLRTRRVDS